MRSLLCALVLVFAGPVAPASAWPVIRALATEPAGTPDHPLVRTWFTLDYVGSGPRSDRFSFGRVDGEQMFGCIAPAGWDCFAFPKGPSVTSYRRIDGPLPPPALTFAVDSVTGEPCVHFQFFTGTNVVSDYDFFGCLEVDGPVPAAPTSWGRVKSTYR